ncbi:hypothetical protein BKA56DRAFT_67524 [Ilyonectria sp. MPI-CAGE-AT-0026]|nr:hypothetical protein BKA56DRAFT_67524 [Ilyonectria sp. MPI-CAGE-AT-0026]
MLLKLVLMWEWDVGWDLSLAAACWQCATVGRTSTLCFSLEKAYLQESSTAEAYFPQAAAAAPRLVGGIDAISTLAKVSLSATVETQAGDGWCPAVAVVAGAAAVSRAFAMRLGALPCATIVLLGSFNVQWTSGSKQIDRITVSN